MRTDDRCVFQGTLTDSLTFQNKFIKVKLRDQRRNPKWMRQASISWACDHRRPEGRLHVHTHAQRREHTETGRMQTRGARKLRCDGRRRVEVLPDSDWGDFSAKEKTYLTGAEYRQAGQRQRLRAFRGPAPEPPPGAGALVAGTARGQPSSSGCS